MHDVLSPSMHHQVVGLLAVLVPQTAPWLVGLGALAGFLAGLIGIGGGFVLVPGLLLLFAADASSGGNSMPVVLATTMSCMIFTSLAAARQQARHGSIDALAFRRMWPYMAAGAALGAVLSTWAPTKSG
jgi:uncharacterized protein